MVKKKLNKEFNLDLDHYSPKKDEISLLLYIEKNSSRLRKKYLKYVHNLGNKKINGSNLVNLLKFDNETTFWWMSLFAEKSFLKSKSINNFIKFIAVEEILKKGKFKKINFTNADLSFSYLLTELCELNKWNFSIHYKANTYRSYLIKIVKRFIPLFAVSTIYLFRFIILSLLFNFKINWHKNVNYESVSVFGHLAHIDRAKLKKDVLHLDHLGELSLILKKKNINVNWFYNFIKSEITPSVYSAKKIIDAINKNSQKNWHNIIGYKITLKLIMSIIHTYLKIYFRFLFLKNTNELFFYEKRSLNCWSIFKDDWNDSIFGTNLLKNIIWLHIFEEILSNIPYQKLGFYVQENQGWERALITRWNKYKHGDLIAFNHTFMRFWDTRYYDEKETLKNNYQLKLPQPKYIAVNGPYCLNEHLKQNYKRKTLVDVEAIRYAKYNNAKKFKQKKIKRILILPSYKKSFSYSMLDCLTEYFSHSENKFLLDIKMHPASKLDLHKINLKYKSLVNKNISEIYKKYDLMITSCDSGAALDAYILGVPLAIYREDGMLNYSPLKDLDKNIFFSTSFELKKVIELLSAKKNSDTKKLFWFSKNNYRWKKLLSNYF